MTLYLVRHAKAGKRSAWDDDDRLRPLSDAGRAQAELIAGFLAPLGPSVLMTSPYVRCRQTLEPLARLIGLRVIDEPGLAEETSLEVCLGVLERAPDRAVLCSHGDVIPSMIDGLVRRGMELTTAVRSVKKASMFELHRRDGVFTDALYIEAPSTGTPGD